MSLSVKDQAAQRRIAADVAAAGVSVTVLPQTNLYLQARDDAAQRVRGIAPVHVLREAGVIVAAGGDNLQDPFNPIGSGDPLETAALSVWAAHQSTDDALDMVSNAATRSCGAMATTFAVGSPADFVALDATSVREAIARRPADRIVVRHGRVV